MKIRLCESQIDEIVIEQLKRWYKHIKQDPTEAGDKELLRSLNCVYYYYTAKHIK